jgi:tetratricopeptide (TPR) repeat protein/transcriptional regulator with XRE-family HTH domain
MGNTAQRNEQLRQHRFRRNWRLQDVADKLGTTITTVQRWERGSQQPSAYYRAKLCELFDVRPQEIGFEEEEALPPTPSNIEEVAALHSASTEEIALWTVPYRRNPYFTGRSDLLDQLEQQLVAPGTGQAGDLRQIALTQAQAVTGLGGIGKTQIAVEYAYRALAQKRYVYTIWITAANEEMILSSLTALADQLPGLSSPEKADQHVIAAAVVGWLERCKQPWLLIFDNADDLSLIQPYLPRRGNGNIVLTTRASAVGSFAAAIEVTTMGLAEGIQFLLRRVQRFNSASDEEIDEVGNLVVELALFPLALDQAGAYIEETGCSVHDYLDLYKRSRHVLLARRGTQITGYPAPVATTWSISFACIEQANPAAADLLRLCAFLSPDHIPEELLTEGAAYWTPALQEAVANPLRFNQMVEDLLRFSLIKRQAENHMLSIHRLVQIVQMEHIAPEEQRRWAEQLIRAMNAIFPTDPANQVQSWDLCQRYLDQVQACDTLIQQHDLVLSDAAGILDHGATYLRECALYSLAEPLYQRALRIQEILGGTEYLPAAQVLGDLACLYQTQGRYEQAEALFQRVLHIRERQLGTEHVLVALSLNDLASLYWQQRLYEQARPLQQRALHMQEQLLGPEHTDVAISLVNLGTIYTQQGLYEAAEPLFQRALRIHEKVFGPEHPQVATTVCNLASLYRHQGSYEQAEPLFWRALSICERLVGPDHPNVTYPLNGLALIYTQQKKDKLAEKFYLRALHIREQKLGPEHPETADVLHDFAGFRRAQGHRSEAATLYQRALAIRERSLGADHPLTVKTREGLHEV